MDWAYVKVRLWVYGIFLIIIFTVSFIYEYFKNLLEVWEDFLDGRYE
jgi:tellurite resistance protein TehA-like permease